ncbi:MAG: trypsin-like peptidase domain-containing protein [Lentisphaeria bacterium]|jgi:serine protease Do/serine protease DegQ
MPRPSAPLRSLAAAALLAAALPVLAAPGSSPAAANPAEPRLQLEDAITRVAEQAFPAVVVITNKQRDRQPTIAQLPPELRRFFGIPDLPEEGMAPPPQPGQPRVAGKGSGVLIRPDGYILTNCHVIDGADALEVKLHDGTVFDNARDPKAVRVVGSDKETDLAVLQVGGGKLRGLPTLPFADAAKVKVGQFAIAVGAPFDLDYSVAVGHVSQKGRYDVNINTFENYIQTDASINPGNSGGPLLNLRGEIIGINEFIITGSQFSRGNIGIGFAIASNLARQVAEGLIAEGIVVRPWLGLAMQPLTDALKQQFKVRNGILVNDVTRGDPAEKAGLKPGDVITKVGPTPVNTPHDLQFAVLAYKPGDKIPLTLRRNGKELTIPVVARRRDAPGATSATTTGGAAGQLEKWGLSLEETKEGIRVKSVSPGTPAAAAALRRGDRILEANRQAVATLDELATILAAAANGSAVLYVERNDRRFFVPISLPGTPEP